MQREILYFFCIFNKFIQNNKPVPIVFIKKALRAISL